MKRLLVFGLLLLSAGRLVRAAEPDLTDLFTSGEHDYGRYRIPALIVSKRGTLLAFCEGRRKAAGLSGDIDLVLRRSFDQGDTWQPIQQIADDGPNTLGNPCPVIDQSTGIIWLLHTRSPGQFTETQIIDGTAKETTTVWITKSEDDGATWSKSIEISSTTKLSDWTWYGTGPGVGIQLAKGRLLIPSYHAVAKSKVYRVHSIYSDDHGQSWKLGGILGDHTTEPQAVQRVDGKVVINARSINKQGFRTLGVSSDGGESWNDVKLDPTLTDPSCQGSLIIYSDGKKEDKSRWLFSNPPGPNRRSLTIRMSYDEGLTWPVAKVLDHGTTEYSVMARLADGRVACLYERSPGKSYRPILSVARFKLDWLTEDSK